jgi:Zn finger protein HypA/HybF involved in hydrogenase expression
VAANTLAQGAELAIDTITLQARCRNCACEFEPARLVSSCPQCGSYAPRLLEEGSFASNRSTASSAAGPRG